ncbi:CPBP family intramembrane glutamic endopeptidase [Alkaliphilus serpentinus]|uniref:CPBP family intramembrane metalloprotease n=1 Tax=Alkaliphilus serpentinus TaxID=1482731 RepID=A0A833M9V2_9FIRM|nr:CPBP family intramembrane glutamic endopeptidase [Alkaliphilus serpentinus]KAB3529389.1 CPBP family intramembrane metalloprotease [Alkaliphilus serpentinus]
MNRKKISKYMTIPILTSVLYVIYFYVILVLAIEQNITFDVDSITLSNVVSKLIADFFIMLFFPLILIVIYWKRLIDFKLKFNHSFLQYSLIIIMLLLFFLHGDFSIKGYYKLFFYLVVVAFGEEFFFRGYVYNELSKYNRILAIVISGLFFGILHAVLPGVLKGYTIFQIGISMLSEIGGGILIGYYFIYLLEKSKSLFIPVFVHAILNYTVGIIGILTAIGTGVYLLINSRKDLKEEFS